MLWSGFVFVFMLLGLVLEPWFGCLWVLEMDFRLCVILEIFQIVSVFMIFMILLLFFVFDPKKEERIVN